MHHSDRVVSCRFHDANSEAMSSVGRDCIHDNRSEFKLLRWFLDARFHRQAIIHNEQTYIKHINSPRHTLAYTLPCPPQSCKEGLQTMATPRALKVWTSLALDVTSLSWWLFAAPKGRPSKPTPTKASRDRDNAQDGLSVLYRNYQRVLTDFNLQVRLCHACLPQGGVAQNLHAKKTLRHRSATGLWHQGELWQWLVGKYRCCTITMDFHMKISWPIGSNYFGQLIWLNGEPALKYWPWKYVISHDIMRKHHDTSSEFEFSSDVPHLLSLFFWIPPKTCCSKHLNNLHDVLKPLHVSILETHSDHFRSFLVPKICNKVFWLP